MLGVCLNYRQKNYGSKLQSLATAEILDRTGLEYEIIQYNKKTPLFIAKYLLRCLNIVFLNDRYEQFQKALLLQRHPDVKSGVEQRNRCFDNFDYQFTNRLSKLYKSYEELKNQCAHQYDQVMVCSDQLWSPSALGSGFYNLMFAPEQMPKLSWAASFGVSNIPWYQIEKTRTYLNRIQHISVREKRGAEIVHELTEKEATVLMDPVFSLTKQEWETLIPRQESEWGKYVFCYFLGPNPKHREAARKLASELGLKIVTLRHLDRYVSGDETFGDYAPYDVDPVRFLNILRNAEYICTDSFHGSAFSLIMERPFLIFDRYSCASANSKNSRIDSLCEKLNIKERRFVDNGSVREAMCQPIDFADVREKLEEYRQQTFSFLKEALYDNTEIYGHEEVF